MKPTRLLPVLAIFLAGCRGCTDQSEKRETTDSITNSINTDSTAQETLLRGNETVADTGTQTQPKTGDQPATPEPVSRDPEPPPKKTDPGVTRNVSQYIISTPKFAAGSNGISQATVTVKNTHPSITFQKVIVEVIVTGANEYMRSNLFTVVNLEPGESKQITVPDSPQGSSMNAKVVKVTQATEN